MLYDMIIYKKNFDNEILCVLIECDYEVSKEVILFFKKYKIRKKVSKLIEVIKKFLNFGLL